MKRKIILAVLLGLFGLGAPSIAMASPDFGTGESQKGPQDPGALCHPPGQTEEFPACK